MIHVEVQNQREKDFQRRMFIYYYRLLDRYNKPLVSIAILGDIDWLMELPPQLEIQFRMEIDRIESEHNMPYITSVERLARIEGREQGRDEGFQEGRSEGEERGVLVGQILFAQKILRREQSSRSELLAQPIAELQHLLGQLTAKIEQNEDR